MVKVQNLQGDTVETARAGAETFEEDPGTLFG
jgi:hypothetical protein